MGSHAVNVVIKARDDASRKFKGVSRAAGGMGKALRAAAGMAAAYLGARAMLNFAKSNIAAFGEQQMAVQHLTDALRALDKEAEVPEMKKFAAEIQRLTVIGDEATIEMMSMAASMGKLSGDSLKAATVAAIGLAKAYKMDTVAAMRLVARAAQGDTASLTRYGIKLGEGLTAQEKFNKVLEIGASNFHLAEGETKTFNGAVDQLKNTWGDAKEKMGQYIADIPGLTEGIKTAGAVIENFGLSMDILWTSAALGMVENAANLKHYLVDIPSQYLTWFVDNWKNIYKDWWSFIKTVYSNIFENTKAFFSAIWSWMNGEGFDFEWTGLLDGFESALSKLPEIAKRAVGPIEEALAEELAGLQAEMALKIKKRLSPETLDVGKLLAGATGGAGKAAASAAGGGGKGLSAFESRFMTMAPGATVDKTEINTGKMVRLLEHVERNISILAKKAERAGMTGKQLEMHVTKFA